MESRLDRKSRAAEERWTFDRHLIWVALILITSAFVLGDAAIVAWYADVVSAAEAVAYGFAFALISIGVLVTAGNLRRLS
jgi:hypothetical protein